MGKFRLKARIRISSKSVSNQMGSDHNEKEEGEDEEGTERT